MEETSGSARPGQTCSRCYRLWQYYRCKQNVYEENGNNNGNDTQLGGDQPMIRLYHNHSVCPMTSDTHTRFSHQLFNESTYVWSMTAELKLTGMRNSDGGREEVDRVSGKRGKGRGARGGHGGTRWWVGWAGMNWGMLERSEWKEGCLHQSINREATTSPRKQHFYTFTILKHRNAAFHLKNHP